jgi:hypothetical protein
MGRNVRPAGPAEQRATPSKPREGDARAEQAALRRRSTLARLEAALRLVDDIDATLAADDAVVAMAAAQRLERVADFHWDLGPRGARGNVGKKLRGP